MTKESTFNLFPIENKDLYRLVLMNTLVAAAAFTAFNVAVSELDAGAQEDYKIKLMAIWEKEMGRDFQAKLASLNNLKLSGVVENSELLPDAEDFQIEFNDIVKDVKRVAAKALWPGKF